MAQLKSTNITGNLAVTGNILASKIIKLSGTDDDILMGDGSTTSKQGLIDSLEAAMEGNSWRPIKYDSITLNDTSTALEFVAGSNIGLTFAGGKLTINNNYSYSLPAADNGTLGGIQIGYTASGANLPVQLSSEQAYVALTKSAIESVVTIPTVNDGTLTLKASDGATATQRTFTANDADNVTFEVKHAVPSGAAVGNYGPSAGGEQEAKGTLDITVPQITTDKFGHITTVSNKTFKVTDTDTTYSKATTTTDGLMSADDKKNLTYYVKGTQTASTGSWTGNLPQVSALYEGLTIRYRLPYAGSGSASLNLTLADGATTGAKAIYRYGSTTRITTHFAAGSVITMTYNGSNWVVDAYYDSNSYAYVRQYQHGTNAAGTENLYPLLARYNVTNKNNSYDTAYSRFHTDAFVDISSGAISANGFKYNDSTLGTNNYVLLAGGGTKAISDFQASGDYVTGPSSSTNNAIPLFNGTGGKTIKNSDLTVDTNRNLDGVNTLGCETIRFSAENQPTITASLVCSGIVVEGIETPIIYAPTTSGGTTYGPGENGQVLKSNGETVYWGTDNSGGDGSSNWINLVFSHQRGKYDEFEYHIWYQTNIVFSDDVSGGTYEQSLNLTPYSRFSQANRYIIAFNDSCSVSCYGFLNLSPVPDRDNTYRLEFTGINTSHQAYGITIACGDTTYQIKITLTNNIFVD